MHAPIDDPAWRRAGFILDVTGQVMVPLGVGAVLGFYAADQGMRLLPTLLELTLGWGVAALLFIGVGRWLRGKAFKDTVEGVRLRRRVVVLAVLGVLALAGRLAVFYAHRPSALTARPYDQFDLGFTEDAARYQRHTQGMTRLVDRLEASGLPAPSHAVPLSAEDERLLLDTWQALFDFSVDLDGVREFYEDWYRYDPSRVERSYHLRSFLLTYAAELALYESGARFTERVLANDNAKKFLDAPHGDLDEGSFSRFRQELLGARDQARVVAGERYLDFLATTLDGRDEARRLGEEWLWQAVEGHLDRIEALGLLERTSLTVAADLQLLKCGVRRVWFPVQKEAAEKMGDTRVRRVGWYLIPPEQVALMDQHLEPGDILLSRKNWYLSNVGLPGFWPHAILYLGTPDKLDAYMDDPEVEAWLADEHGAPVSFSDHLRKVAPTAALTYALGAEGHPWQVIEAVSEGVVFNTLEHAAGDYVAALRPRLDKVTKARAITEAFRDQGKPYDFDFDFATDHALVCTELVWRSYTAVADKTQLDLPLVEVAGRLTLPANELVRIYALQAPSPLRQLDFVWFIDAHEKERTTFVADEAAFRESWARPRWDTAQR